MSAEIVKPKKSFQPTPFLTGLVGFVLATATGFLTTYLLFQTGLLRLLLNLAPENQPLVRVLLNLFLIFVGVGLGGAVNGVLRGYTLHRIDRGGSRRRYLLGGAFAYGISQGVLLIPMLLLIAIIGKYNQGSSKDPASFLILFTFLGGVYGLVSGLILALITLRLRYIWLPWLASIVGTALGGAMLGLVIWQHQIFLGQSTSLLQLLAFFIFLVLAVGLAGSALGMVYRWIEGRRLIHPETKLEPARWQDIIVIAGGIILFLAAISLTNTLLEFVTIHTGTTTTSLGLETQGVQWYSPALVTTNIIDPEPYPPGFDASSDGTLAAAWATTIDGQRTLVYAYQPQETTGELSWSDPIKVSNSSKAAPEHPQLALDSSGRAHIVWSEEIDGTRQILYSNCQGETCLPPVVISEGACSEQATSSNNDWPAIIISEQGSLLVAWNAGGLIGYRTWVAGAQPTAQPAGCSLPVSGSNSAWQPRLAAWGDTFTLVYSSGEAGSSAPIGLIEINAGSAGTPQEIGAGSLAEVYRDHESQIHLAWCSGGGVVTYFGPNGTSGQIDFPLCQSRPGIVQDNHGRLHLTWYSNQVRNNFGEQLPMQLIYESILLESGWSEPAIVARPSQASWPASTSMADGILFLAWVGVSSDSPALFYSRQDPYHCVPVDLSDAALKVLDVVESGQFHPKGYQAPFCGNQYEIFIYMPNANPEFSSAPATPNGGFDRLAVMVQEAKYEILLSNMQWDEDQDGLSPGYRVVEGIGYLYEMVKADPESYPRGMTVRILLGNYPNLATFTYGDQIWNVINGLHKAGVKMEDPDIGWKVEVANYRGTYPHAHTKFEIIDGESLLSAGFNISWFHLPESHSSGKGDDLTDLGLLLTGPVAQPAMAAFDDQWNGANQLVCSDMGIGEDTDRWQKSCEWQTASVSHPPEVLKYYLTGQDQTAFALYRTDIYKEADQAYVAAIGSARHSIDAIHVNFSAQLVCWLELIAPGVCTFDENALPWMKALVDAVEQNHTQVRVIVENANSNGIENRIGLKLLNEELSRRGLSEFVELRFFDGRVHSKSALIDGQLLFVGSQNFHYSSFGTSGLLEFVAATESPEAIQAYQEMFEYYWQQAIPADEAVWGTTSSE